MEPEEKTAPLGQPLGEADWGNDDTSKTDTLPGQMLGEYRVISRIGHGGMGVLYRGLQPLIGRAVAIKVMQPDTADGNAAQRMVGEAKAANAVRHQNIVDIFAFGQLPDGRPYMVMELLPGRSLAQQLQLQGKLDAAETLTVLVQAAAALEAAHAAGIVHRDLKPENIFVHPQPEGWTLKLIDFGLARDDLNEKRLTQPGLVMGTPGFMAPEQARGADVTGKADVYALGIVAWTVLMGREPYEGGSAIEVMHRHLSAPIPPLDAGPLPAGLAALVRQMMDKEPAKRPTASEVKRAVTAMLSAPLAPAKPASSRGVIYAVSGAAVVVALSTVALLWGALAHPRPEALEPIAAFEPVPVPQPPPRPEPVAAALMPVEEPAPVAAVPPAVVDARAERVWPCDHIATVSPVHIDGFHAAWQFFQVRFTYERPLVVAVEVTKPKRRQQLNKLRDTVSNCRGTTHSILANHVDERHRGFHTDLLTQFGGDVVLLDDLSVPGVR